MLRIGWAKREISTEENIIISGQRYMRVSEGVLDPVFVTALTIDDGKDYVIFLQSDTVSIFPGIVDEVRAELSRRNKHLDPMKVLMNASHTHTGPYVGQGDIAGTWGHLSDIPHEGYDVVPPGAYRQFYIDRVCEAICESFNSRTEGAVAYGYGFATVAHSRRVVYTKDWGQFATNFFETENGHARMYGETNDETFSHYEAGTDSFANFLFTFDKHEKLTGAIVNIPCPSQNSEQEWVLSADYWHDVRQELKNSYGDIFVLPQCAAAGDLSPRQLHYKAAEARRYRLKYADWEMDPRLDFPMEILRRKDIAKRICNAFDEVYSWARKEIFHDLPVVHTVKTVNLDRRIITEEEYIFCKEQMEKPKEEIHFVNTGDRKKDLVTNSHLLYTDSRCADVVNRYNIQKEQPKIPMELHVIKLGNIAFASNRFELYMDYQHRIQARSPFEQTFIIQLCGQPGQTSGSYLATERGVWGRGYSATRYCNLVSPSGGQQLVEETLAELNRIY